MRLIEGVTGKLLPVTPYLLQYLRIVPISLSLLDELRFHLVNDSLLFLTHCLS